LIRLAVRVDREHSELVLAELLELAPAGVEETDVSEAVVEYAVYGAPGELPALPDLKAAAGGALVEISTSEIADDWSERWREFHRPLVLDDRLTVRPPWEPPGQSALDVVIDPGFVDVGCGSGVLAIVASKLGWDPVLALDHDRAAVQATRENAARNEVTLDVRLFDLGAEQVPDCDFGAANVLAGPLAAWAASQRRLPPALIIGGLLAEEADGVASAFASRGLLERERRELGGWAALVLAQAPSSASCASASGARVRSPLRR
jgi:ribosomal protein L11 methyltransferase